MDILNSQSNLAKTWTGRGRVGCISVSLEQEESRPSLWNLLPTPKSPWVCDLILLLDYGLPFRQYRQTRKEKRIYQIQPGEERN